MGAKGFSGVGLNEILVAAGVPKGSFYHYFGSKEAFGEALLADYFEDYLADIDATLAEPGLSHAERLMNYWRKWQATQGSIDYQRKCLAVKLAAEVSDLSEPMRLALKRGTAGIIDRVTGAIEAGVAEGSLRIDGDAARDCRDPLPRVARCEPHGEDRTHRRAVRRRDDHDPAHPQPATGLTARAEATPITACRDPRRPVYLNHQSGESR